MTINLRVDYDVEEFVGGQDDRDSIVEIVDRNIADIVGEDPTSVSDVEEIHTMSWKKLELESAILMARVALQFAKSEDMVMLVSMRNEFEF